MRKSISEALEFIVGVVIASVIIGWVAWNALAFVTADVPDVKIKTHDRPST